jgi:hypothetical protein
MLKWPTKPQGEILALLEQGWRLLVPPSSPAFVIPPLSFRRKAKRVRTQTIRSLQRREYLRTRWLLDGFKEYRLSSRGRRTMKVYLAKKKEKGDGRWNRSGRTKGEVGGEGPVAEWGVDPRRPVVPSDLADERGG